MKYSLTDIIKSLPKSKNSKSSQWVRHIVRPLSFLFTYLFINLNCSAWLASVLSVFVAIIGCALLCLHSICLNLLGVILINFWLVLDCVDGNIARITKTTSLMGEFIDALSGYYISTFVYFSFGIAAYNYSNQLIYVYLGAFASLFNILTRLIHQKYVYSLLSKNRSNNNTIEKDVDNKRGLQFIRSRFDKELGLSGFLMPFLIFSFIVRNFTYITLFYFIFSLLALLVITLYYSYLAKDIKGKIIIGYTTGVFDMFHQGHLNILKKAKENCDYLIVGVSTDELVESYKNKTPIIPYNQRKNILESIFYVDKVIPQKTRNKIEAYNRLKFDKMFVGDDWKGNKLFADTETFLKSHNVTISYFRYTQGISSTILRKKMIK